MEKAFEGVAGFDDVSYVDRWGDLYTAYAPVFGTDGSVKAVVGVDVWASWYKGEIASSVGLTAILTGVTLVLGIAATIIIVTRIRKKIDTIGSEALELDDSIDKLLMEVDLIPNHDLSEVELGDDDNDKNTLTVLRKRIYLDKENINKYLGFTHQQSLTDKLTKLGNRTAYYDLVKVVERQIANNERVFFAVAIFEINGLKELDDEYGYDMGDKVILETANIVAEAFTKERSFRIGGGIFAVIYQNIEPSALDNRMKDFEEILDDKNSSGEFPFELSIARGYSLFDPKEDKKFSAPFTRAAQMMDKEKEEFYKALKKQNKNK